MLNYLDPSVRAVFMGILVITVSVALGLYIASIVIPRGVIFLILAIGIIGVTNFGRRNPIPTLDGGKTLSFFGIFFLTLMSGGVFFLNVILTSVERHLKSKEDVPSFGSIAQKIRKLIKFLFGDLKPYLLYFLIVYIFRIITNLSDFDAPSYFFESVIGGGSFFSSAFNLPLLLMAIVIVPVVVKLTEVYLPQVHTMITLPEFEPEYDVEGVHIDERVKDNEKDDDDDVFDPSKGIF